MPDFAPAFAAPQWLLGLPLAWALCWCLGRSGFGRSAWRRLCEPRLLALLGVAGNDAAPARWLAGSLALLFSLGLLAAAGPGWRPATEAPLQSAAARVIALDLGRAMLVQDLQPSRYAHARAAARELLESGFDGETALLVYAGAVFTVAPLTRDAGTLRAFLDALEPGIVPVDGARVDLAIARAAQLLDASISGRGEVMVLASGVQQPGAAIAAARRARAAGHRVSLFAVGSAAGGPRVAADGSLERDGQGAYRLAKTDGEALAHVAAAGGGRFASVSGGGALLLDSALDAQSLVSGDDSLADAARETANEGYWLVWLMIVPLLLLFRRNLVYAAPLALALGLTGAPDADAVDWGRPWTHADKAAWQAYRQGDYARAAELSSAPLLRGAARYRQGDWQRALAEYEKLDDAAAHFNRGNTLVRLERYIEAIAAYELALQREPGWRAARFNLRLVKLYLENRRESASGDPRDPGGADDSLDAPPESTGAGAALRPDQSPEGAAQVDGGDGASLPSGLYNPLEAYSGRETPPTRLAADDLAANAARAEVDAWIRALPASATELFERKFRRDHQRAQRGDR